MPLYKRMQRSIAGRDEDGEEDEEDEEGEEDEEDEEGAADAAGDEKKARRRAELLGTSPEVPAQWVERMQVTAPKALRDAEFNPDDDALREELFEQQCVAGVNQALHLLQQHGIPYKRPSDYYAEMVKSDVHMARVRESLDQERERISRAQQRRAQRHSKQFGKQVQAQVAQERAQKKNEQVGKLAALKKKGKMKGWSAHGKADDEIDVAFGGDGDDGGGGSRGKGAGGQKRKRSLAPGGSVPGAKRRKAGKSKRPGKGRRHR